MTGLAHLPTEILIAIVEDELFTWYHETLFHLSLVCRRLHFIALPVYLGRKGLWLDSTSFVAAVELNIGHYGTPNLFSGLSIALFPIRIDDVTCILPHPSCTSIYPLVLHIRRLTRWIGGPNLQGPRSLTLQPDRQGSDCLSVGNDEQLRAWADAMGELLSTVVGKGCVELNLRYGAQFTKTYVMAPGSPSSNGLRGILRKLSRPFRGAADMEMINARFRRNSRFGSERVSIALRRSISSEAKISRLGIASAILVKPPGLRWTLSLLQTCRITSLTLDFDALADRDYKIWLIVLPLIANAASGNLTTLNLQNVPFQSDQLVLSFISRLPHLVELAIGCEHTPQSQTKVMRLPLCHLRSLRGPPHHVALLLRMGELTASLSSICILWPANFRSEALDSPGLIGAVLHNLFQLLDNKHIVPTITLAASTEMYMYPAVPYMYPADLPIGAELKEDTLSETLGRVDILQIQVNRYTFADLLHVVGWITPFPRLRRVEIKISGDCMRQDFLHVAKKARQECGWIKEVIINGEEL
ncbi:hypothetical protein C8F01DRAFT_1138728 [Mycena amicta]|nr:hypothetical protein C8F01DRAFT_1138728 [Mycena amicta]